MFEYTTQDPTLAALESLLSGGAGTDVDSQAAMESVASVINRVKGLPDTVKNRKADNAAAKEALGSMDAKKLIKTYFDIKTQAGLKLGTGAMCRTELQEFNKMKADGVAGLEDIDMKQSAYNGKTILIVTTKGENVPFTEVHYEKVAGSGNAVKLTVVAYATMTNVVAKSIKGGIKGDRAAAKAAEKEAAKAANTTGGDEAASESFIGAMSAMESTLIEIDKSIAAMEAFTNESLSKALKNFQEAVDSKCNDINCANELYSKISGQSEQYNNLLGTIADAVRKLGTGVFDKDGMKAVVVPAMTELKKICTDCGLSVTDASDEITDEEITNLRALLMGAKEIVSRKKDELTGGGGCPDPVKDAGASESFKGLLGMLESAKIATESAKEDSFDVDEDDFDETDMDDASESMMMGAFEGFGVEDIADGTIAMEGLSEVLSSVKALPSKVKASRASDKALLAEIKSRDPRKLVKDYLDMKTKDGMKLGTGQLVKAMVEKINNDEDYQSDGAKATLLSYGGKPVAILSYSDEGGAFAYIYYEEQQSQKTILRTASFKTVATAIKKGITSSAKADAKAAKKAEKEAAKAAKAQSSETEGADEAGNESFQAIIDFCKGVTGALEGEGCDDCDGVKNGDDATKAAKDNIDNTEIYVAEDGEIEDEDDDE